MLRLALGIGTVATAASAIAWTFLRSDPPAPPPPHRDTVEAPSGQAEPPPSIASDRADVGGSGRGTQPARVAPRDAPDVRDREAVATVAEGVDTSPLAPAPPPAPAPRFDLVRVEPDGGAVVAATAPSGARVRLELDGAVAGRGVADRSGGLVLFLDLPPADRPRVLALVATLPDGREARSEGLILAPTSEALLVGTAARGAAAADAAPAPPPASHDALAAAAPLRKRAQAPARGAELAVTAAPSVPATRAAAAPAVLRAGARGVTVLQRPGAVAEAVDRVVVDVISYDETGGVVLEGRSAPPPPPVDRVRVYLDGVAIDSAPIAEDGTWRLPLSDIRGGTYTLRVDQLDAAGRVVSRFETPFRRESPAALARFEAAQARAAAEGGAPGLRASVVTVQPGATLWGIASDRYGSGFRYVQIFEANADRIRDPDLIYPGQVFDLPESEGDAAR